MQQQRDGSIVSVSEAMWFKAQEYESYYMVLNNRKNGYLKLIYKFIKALRRPRLLWQYLKYRDFYCGDDWNYWWMQQFENYKVLPKSFDKMLEVGSGPYTNARLIACVVDIKEMYFTDPLMHLYKAFRKTWLSEMFEKGKIHAETGKAEHIEYPDNCFDLVVCNNVLDHVENADQCLAEMRRVLKPGGYLVFGQDLTNEEDMDPDKPWRTDVGHPIKLHHEYLEKAFAVGYDPKLKKILSREESRVPTRNYGTYIFIGVKR